MVRVPADGHFRAGPSGGGRNYLGDCPDDFDILFGVVDSPVVGLNLDVGHANVTRNLVELLTRHGHRLINTHIHDRDGTADSHKPVGQGTVDWPDVLARMVKVGYRGPLNLEFAETSGGYGSTIA